MLGEGQGFGPYKECGQLCQVNVCSVCVCVCVLVVMG